MVKGSKHQLSFFAIKPALELLGKGSILPSSNKGLLFPFKSVNVNSVVITITKVYTDNIGQFLQVNNLSGTYQMHRVSRKVLRRRINLKSLKKIIASNVVNNGVVNPIAAAVSNCKVPIAVNQLIIE